MLSFIQICFAAIYGDLCAHLAEDIFYYRSLQRDPTETLSSLHQTLIFNNTLCSHLLLMVSILLMVSHQSCAKMFVGLALTSTLHYCAIYSPQAYHMGPLNCNASVCGICWLVLLFMMSIAAAHINGTMPSTWRRSIKTAWHHTYGSTINSFAPCF
jgi:hypothetical protein